MSSIAMSPDSPSPLATSTLLTTLLTALLLVSVASDGARAAQLPQPEAAEAPITTRAELEAATPKSANPYLNFLPPGVKPDYRYWSAKVRFDSWDRALENPSPPTRGATVIETEDNDTLAGANPIPGLVAGGGAVQISGETDIRVFYPAVTSTEVGSCSNENFLVATPVSLFNGATTPVNGAIGDCSLGQADVDVYRFFLFAGDTISVDVNGTGQNLNAFLFGESPWGMLDQGSVDPYSGAIGSPRLSASAPESGTYYVSIRSFSGTGSYEALFRRNAALDHFSVELEAGDVISVTSSQVTEIAVVDSDNRERFGSYQPSSDLFPPSSPLLRTATGSEVHAVARESGTHYIRVRSIEPFQTPYNLQARVFRPGTEQGATQKIFIDFDGATINANALFDSGPGFTNVSLSPLSAFLGGWGLGVGDQNAVIDEILAVIEENFAELAAVQPGFTYELLNSRDHADPFGQPGVSRVIIGGTQAQLGRETIGVASSIDPGNYDLEDTAVVLLDRLSGPASSSASLNQFTLFGDTTILDVIGIGVGNIASHEVGHFVGVWHSESQNDIHALVDGGGALENILGSDDTTIGDFDDEDVDFVDDIYSAGSGISGLEDQAGRVAFAMTSATEIFSDGFESGSTQSWTSESP